METERRARARLERTAPWLMAALLAAAYGPGILRSALLQGDLPGHLEMVRWSAEVVWPLPWGWDPRYLGGAMNGTQYPPLLAWVGGGLARIVGAEAALRALLLASVVAVPPCLVRAARGLGLRRGEALAAAVAATCVLWLPGRGLGGSFHQTLVAGNAANGLVLPVFLLYLGRLRASLGRPGRIAGAGVLLAAVLLGHLLVGAVAGLTTVAYALFGARRRGTVAILRGAGVAALGLAGAAPFVVPFLAHAREGAAGGIAFNPPPAAVEWLVLAGLGATLVFGGRRVRRSIAPAAALLAALYLARAIVFPTLGIPDVRMEYHRFRLYLYLAAVPAAALLLGHAGWRRTLGRGLAAVATLTLIALAALARPDVRGPAPQPLPTGAPDFRDERVLVLASPEVQDGSWHGLQMELPAVLGFEAPKGLFVESAPWARAVFEVERAVATPDAHPRWWGIRIAPEAEVRSWDASEVSRRLGRLGVGWILAREPVSPLVRRAETEPPRDLGAGYRLHRVERARRAVSLIRDGAPVEVDASPRGDRLRVRLPAGGDRVRVAVAASSHWRVERGEGVLGRTPDGLLLLAGTGEVVLRAAPRAAEWTGLAIGAAGFTAAAAAGTRRRRRGQRSRIQNSSASSPT